MKEIWKDVKGYEGRYQVSSLSRVRSMERILHCKNGKKYTKKGRIMSICLSSAGYCKLTLYRKVKDFDSADSITTDKAIEGMRQFDREISAIKNKIKKLSK